MRHKQPFHHIFYTLFHTISAHRPQFFSFLLPIVAALLLAMVLAWAALPPPSAPSAALPLPSSVGTVPSAVVLSAFSAHIYGPSRTLWAFGGLVMLVCALGLIRIFASQR